MVPGTRTGSPLIFVSSDREAIQRECAHKFQFFFYTELYESFFGKPRILSGVRENPYQLARLDIYYGINTLCSSGYQATQRDFFLILRGGSPVYTLDVKSCQKCSPCVFSLYAASSYRKGPFRPRLLAAQSKRRAAHCMRCALIASNVALLWYLNDNRPLV